MLGLSDPLWNGLNHVYGPAGDVPGRIRQLAAVDDDEFERILNSLMADVYHQHDATSAGVAVVPHLAQLAETTSPRRFIALVEAIGVLIAANGRNPEKVADIHLNLTEDYLAIVRKMPGLLGKYMSIAWDRVDPCLVAGLILMLKGHGAWVEELWQLHGRRWALPCPECGASIDVPRSRGSERNG